VGKRKKPIKKPTQSSCITALIRAATETAKKFQGEGANWISVNTMQDRSRVMLTTVIKGHEKAQIVLNRHQLADLRGNLQASLNDLK
jgi:ribosomal protein L20